MSAETRPSLDVERTRLANERTFLAWWRTGVAAIAVAFAIGRIVPATVSGTTAWPYVTLGVFLGLAGLALIVYGAKRYRAVDSAIRTGSSPVPNDRMLLVLSAVGVVLGLATVLLVALEV